jgi:hypothetical protein
VTYTAGAGPNLTLFATQTANGGTSAQGSKLVTVATMVAADFDSDCDVDADDATHIIDCISGPQVQPAIGCQSADLDQDNDVDQSDFGLFQRCYSGQNTPANPACMQ